VSEHQEREDHGWEIQIPDHPGRTESRDFRRAKATMHKILTAAAQQATGPGALIAAISA
jgi:hypothetical protein